MGSRICCCIFLGLQIVSFCCFVYVTSRPFVVALNQTASLDSRNESGSGIGFESGGQVENAEECAKGLSKKGSTPPRCEQQKCFGCSPCEAIQVVPPISKKHKHLGVTYTNYEPEDWKCKCGSSFYSP